MIRYAPMTSDPHAPAWARQDSTLAPALETLRAQVNRHWPHRDHTSDGTIGDAAHLAEGAGSDHCPWLDDTVRAADFDKDGMDADWFAESLRRTGHAGDHRLAGGGYVIYDGRITTPDFSAWVAYHGADPHTSHVHVSLTRNPDGFRDAARWAFLDGTPAPAPQPAHPGPVRGEGPHAGNEARHAPAPLAPPHEAQPGPPPGHDAAGHTAEFRAAWADEGPNIAHLKAELHRVFPDYAELTGDSYDADLAAVVLDFAGRAAADPSLPEHTRQQLATADGYNIGDDLAAALEHYGLRL